MLIILKKYKPLFKVNSIEQKYRKIKFRYRIIFALMVVIIIALSYYIYLNCNYLAFKHLIAQNYMYTDTLDKIYKEELNIDCEGEYYNNFDNAVISIVTNYISELNGDKYTHVYLPGQLNELNDIITDQAELSYYRELDINTIYLKITNISKPSYEFFKESSEHINKYENIILDLRGNPGGDIFILNNIVDMFLDKGATISTNFTRVKLFSSVHKSRNDSFFNFDNIVILQDNKTASSSEGLILALKENLNNVTVIGQKSFGKGIGQFTMPLKGGFAVKATVLKWFGPNGTSIDKIGIPPDIQYLGDDIVDYAKNFISS